MIALDTNILVYAHRRDSPFHEAAAERIREMAEGTQPWAIPWPCLHEFFALATHPRVYDPPSTTGQACAQISAWLESPSLVLISEGSTHWATLSTLLTEGKVAGPLVHDARIAALCLAHGVTELWTIDRDFSRFPALKTRNPLRLPEKALRLPGKALRLPGKALRLPGECGAAPGARAVLQRAAQLA